MSHTADQLAQAEALADNLAGLLGVSRETALRFAEIIRPHFERGESIEGAIAAARAQVQRLTLRLAERRHTPEFKEFARSTCVAMYDDLRAAAAGAR